MKKLILTFVVAALSVAGASSLRAQDKAPEKPGQKQAPNGMPFRGKIKSVDAAAKSLTLEGEKARVVLVTSETKIRKDGKPGTFDDLKAGDTIGGFGKAAGENKVEARTINAGVPPVKKEGEKKEEKK